jgi:hypothetical protein
LEEADKFGCRSDQLSSPLATQDLPDEPKTAPDVQKTGANVKVVAGQYHLSGSFEVVSVILMVLV